MSKKTEKTKEFTKGTTKDLDLINISNNKQKSLTEEFIPESLSEDIPEDEIVYFETEEQSRPIYYSLMLTASLFMLLFTVFIVIFGLTTVNRLSSSVYNLEQSLKSKTVTNQEFSSMTTSLERIDDILTGRKFLYKGDLYRVPEPYYLDKNGDVVDPYTNIHYMITYIDKETEKMDLQPTRQSVYIFLFDVARTLEKSEDIEWVEMVFNKVMEYFNTYKKYPNLPDPENILEINH